MLAYSLRISARSEVNWRSGSGAILRITGRSWSAMVTLRVVLYIPVPSSAAESTFVCVPKARRQIASISSTVTGC